MSNNLSKIKTFMVQNPQGEAEKSAIPLALNSGTTIIIKEVPEIRAWAVCDWDDKVIALFIQEENVSDLHKD